MGSVGGKVAAVTGAGSGIGRAVALELVRRGARVAISDVDVEGLAGTAERVAATGGEAHRSPLDVGDRDAVDAYAAAVADHFGVVHQVYNNAGVAWARPILETSVDSSSGCCGSTSGASSTARWRSCRTSSRPGTATS